MLMSRTIPHPINVLIPSDPPPPNPNPFNFCSVSSPTLARRKILTASSRGFQWPALRQTQPPSSSWTTWKGMSLRVSAFLMRTLEITVLVYSLDSSKSVYFASFNTAPWPHTTVLLSVSSLCSFTFSLCGRYPASPVQYYKWFIPRSVSI